MRYAAVAVYTAIMRKSVIFGIVTAVVFVVVGILTLSNQKEAGDPNQLTNSQQDTNDQESTVGQAGQGAYIAYSEAGLSEAKGTRILFFHASWCPQCRALDADIKKQGVPAGTTILKVDYDKAQDLRKKYGVTLQTTVVKVDEKGNLISKFTPYEKPTLDNALSNL